MTPPLLQLAKKYHPDTNGGDADAAKTFAEINEAYEVLDDQSEPSCWHVCTHTPAMRMQSFGSTVNCHQQTPC